jgi:hypothetical protein
VISFLNGMIIELGRKTWAPSMERPGVESYSSVWGLPLALSLWGLALVASMVCALTIAYKIDFLAVAGPLFVALLLMSCVTGFIPVATQNREGSSAARANLRLVGILHLSFPRSRSDDGEIMDVKPFLYPEDTPDVASMGGKACALARLGKNFPVPAWFVIPPHIQPERIRNDIGPALEKLGGNLYAIRSSAVDEDGAGHSFAGQFQTYLNVGAEDVLEKIEHVRSSGPE